MAQLRGQCIGIKSEQDSCLPLALFYLCVQKSSAKPLVWVVVERLGYRTPCRQISNVILLSDPDDVFVNLLYGLIKSHDTPCDCLWLLGTETRQYIALIDC